jgi:hypothetical protein
MALRMNRKEPMSAISLQKEERVLAEMPKAAALWVMERMSHVCTQALLEAGKMQISKSDSVFCCIKPLLVQCQHLQVGFLSALDTTHALMEGKAQPHSIANPIRVIPIPFGMDTL